MRIRRQKKNPSGGVNHLDGRPDHPDVSRDVPLLAYQAPDSGCKGQGVIALQLDGTWVLARDPADITTGRLIPREGSPIVNALLEPDIPEDRPVWATAVPVRHAVSARSGVCLVGLTVPWNTGAMNRLETDRSGEVSGKPSM